MNRLFSFLRTDLFLSLAGGFALGLAGMALVKPASATSEKTEKGAILIEGLEQGVASDGKIAQN